MPHKRIDQKTSRTAEWTCISRAASALEADGPYRGDDHLALRLIPGLLKTGLQIPWVRRFFMRVMAPKGIYEYTIARTKYMDGVYQEALAKGFDQILIFGAGFDTRALRFERESGHTRIFEVDAAVTQAAKLGRYKEKGIEVPARVCFIAMDFDRESLVDKLEAAGFQKGGRTLFMMEGLLMYLDPASVKKTFQTICDCAGKGSELVFDYVRAEVFRNPQGIYGGAEILKSTSKAGETWRFGMDEDQIALFLEPYGLTLMDHKNAEDLKKQYFTERPGKMPGPINTAHNLVRAEKI
nr:SAM-dependent methyltransferase [Desulfobacula sp.]